MAIALVGYGSPVTGTGAITVNYPASIASGHVAILAVSTRNQAVPAVTDYTAHASSPVSNGNARITVLYKVLDGTETSISVGDSGQHQTAVVAVYSGVDNSSPFNVSNSANGATGSPSGAALTTTVNDTVVLAFLSATQADGGGPVTYSSGGWADTDVTNETERVDYNGGNGTGLGVYSGTLATAGATGNFSVTASESSNWALLTTALKPQTSTAYSMTLDAGSYTQSGTAITLKSQRNFPLTPGSYTQSGTAITLKAQHKIAIAAGSYAQTGTAIGLVSSLSIDIDAGSYSYSGTDFGLRKQVSLSLDPGSYVYSGTTIEFRASLSIDVDAGSYSKTGTAIGFRTDRLLVLDPGSYAISGPEIVLTSAYRMGWDAGSYTFTISDVDFTYADYIHVWVPSEANSLDWTAVAGVTDTWTPVDPASDDWTAVDPASNEWTVQ